MKKARWMMLLACVGLVLSSSACPLGNITVTILQTSDLHHHASGYGPYADYTPLASDGDIVLGGYARLAALIKGIKERQNRRGMPTLLFDSGDFLMGTVYDLANENPPAFAFFQSMGYDAVTLGNHEFDWSPSGLALLLANAAANGFNVPVVATNMDVPEGCALKGLVDSGVISRVKVLSHPCGVKIGIIGLMGRDADSKAPVARPVSFNHDYAFIQSQVDYLRKVEKVRVVIALSHGGVNEDGSGDDVDLANNVKGIDIIASGHYHTATSRPIVAGPSRTIIFSPGEYGKYLSRLDVTYNVFTRKLVDYTFDLIPVDDGIVGDAGMDGLVKAYDAGISAVLVSKGLPALKDPVSSTTFPLEMVPCSVTGLGALAADSLRAVANSLAPYNGGDPFDVGIVASGVIRDEILGGVSGIITFADAYNVLPLGISPYDQSVPGYPLMSAYASGEDIYTICEVSLSLAPLMGSDYYLNFSGLRIDYDPSGAPTFSGVQSVEVYDPSDVFCLGPTEPVDPDGTYRIVVDLYALQMLSVVNEYLIYYGLPPISPQNPSRIDRDPLTSDVQELKEWMALMSFLPSLGTSIPEAVYGPGGVVYGRVY
ncbi:MAG TPA: 5'-nucleotidase C-terminal domain-containing protein [Deltaproteobacteria bacterium]|nr:5'-nucleotidase C-terminal domain-containing protein [Deltaproteobacteria bacterium]